MYCCSLYAAMPGIHHVHTAAFFVMLPWRPPCMYVLVRRLRTTQLKSASSTLSPGASAQRSVYHPGSAAAAQQQQHSSTLLQQSSTLSSGGCAVALHSCTSHFPCKAQYEYVRHNNRLDPELILPSRVKYRMCITLSSQRLQSQISMPGVT